MFGDADYLLFMKATCFSEMGNKEGSRKQGEGGESIGKKEGEQKTVKQLVCAQWVKLNDAIVTFIGRKVDLWAKYRACISLLGS